MDPKEGTVVDTVDTVAMVDTAAATEAWATEAWDMAAWDMAAMVATACMGAIRL